MDSLQSTIKNKPSTDPLPEEDNAEYQKLLTEFTGIMDRNGKIQFANTAPIEGLGYASSDVIGKHFWEASWFTQSTESQRSVKECAIAATRGEPSNCKAKTYTKIGTPIATRFTIRPLEGMKGELATIITISILENEKPSTQKTPTESSQTLDNESAPHTEESRRPDCNIEESAQWHRMLVNLVPDAIFLVDPDWTIRSCNLVVEKMTGYSIQEVQGLRFHELLVDKCENIEKVDELLNNPLEEESVQEFELLFRHKNGTEHWSSITAAALNTDGNRIGILLVARDVTMNKQAEAEVAEAGNRYNAIFDNPLQSIFICDLEGRFLEMNRYGRELLGYSLKEIRNLKYQEVVHPEDISTVLESLVQVTSGDTMPIQELRILHKTGRAISTNNLILPLIKDGQTYAVIGFAQDITLHKVTDGTSDSSEARLQELVTKLELSQKEISTPVIQVWDHVLALPLIGIVDDIRAQHVMETLLAKIVDTHTQLVIIDVTGVASMDTDVTNHLIRTIQATSLLGAQCVLTGIQPEIAQTLIALGSDLSTFVIKRDMQDGIKYALAQTGHQIQPDVRTIHH
ncbi:MAG: PAS domain S-box protein [Chloroflexota bacterium]|nr:PAS domain S-box protein [Chloroflexota bacterium]